MSRLNKIVNSLSFIEEFVAVTERLSEENDIDVLLSKVITSACQFTCADGGRIYMLDSTAKELNLSVSYWRERYSNSSWFESIRIDNSQNISRKGTTDPFTYALITGTKIIVNQLEDYPYLNKDSIYRHDQLNQVNTESFILVPLVSPQKQTIGLLELVNARDRDAKLLDWNSIVDVIAAFSAQAAMCINNLLLIDSNEKLIHILDSTNKKLINENQRLRKSGTVEPIDYQIIGESRQIKRVFKLMQKVLDSKVSVLLRGETGTGKEVFAQAIHSHGVRKDRPFISQNCAALPEQLLESELFGYKKGAFTGANTDKQGIFSLADGGTLFLDEIGDMPLGLQAKVLRVLQENEIRPLGGIKNQKVDVRIIAATHCNLEEKISKGEFREDLFFRLAVFPLHLPPLRERGTDVILLANYFIKKMANNHVKKIAALSPAASELLMTYDFPGNVRELQNMIERAVLLCDSGGIILPDHLQEYLRNSIQGTQPVADPVGQTDALSRLAPFSISENYSLKDTVNEFERLLIEKYLAKYHWHQTNTAKALNIPRRTLIDKMRRFNISRPLY